jgi:hypothetical protein
MMDTSIYLLLFFFFFNLLICQCYSGVFISYEMIGVTEKKKIVSSSSSVDLKMQNDDDRNSKFNQTQSFRIN